MFPVNVSCHAKVLIAASFIAAFSPILPAQAADVVDVRGSQPTVIYSMGIYYTNDCYAGPLPRLQKGYSRAQHGKLTSKVETGTISKGHCKGKPVKRTAVIYTADKGFRGRDTVRIGYSIPGHAGAPSQGGGSSEIVIVNVK